MNLLGYILILFFNFFVSCDGSMSWLIDIKYGGARAAKRIARKHNLIYKRRIDQLNQIFELQTDDNFKTRQRRSATRHGYRSEKEMEHDIRNSLYHEKGVVFVEKVRTLVRKTRGFNPSTCCDNFNDPEYPNQWFYRNNLRLDMNIEGAWKQGFTGKGVVVTILDDGVEHTHDDLKDNWDKEASYDFTDQDPDPLPQISEEADYENTHGTRCAGQVAASANNSKCGVGAAFEASIGGIRMLDASISDSVECLSLEHRRDHIDIYSMSWGPEDDGKTVDGPGHCTKKALKDGTKYGRKGKGSIFVWASGNGGRINDDCNLDGYVSSIYTIGISAISSSGLSPWYSESCACTFASAYSSGFHTDHKIVTTDVHNKCTYRHTGTSAAAPLAAGILALALQANPELTWRDMQHLIVRTARKVSNNGDEQWTTNGAGHEFHPKLGFGVLDATRMVNMARNWTHVPPQRKCSALKMNRTKVIPPLKILRMITTVYPEDCADKVTGRWGEDHLNKLEHVQLFVTMTSPTRGDILLKLKSPSGTVSKLLSVRPEDTDHGPRYLQSNSNGAFRNWAFMTVNLWDESPYGKWELQIINSNQKATYGLQPTRLKKFRLVFYGSRSNSSVEESYEHDEMEDNELNGGGEEEGDERSTSDTIEESEEEIYQEEVIHSDDDETTDDTGDDVGDAEGTERMVEEEDESAVTEHFTEMPEDDEGDAPLVTEETTEGTPAVSQARKRGVRRRKVYIHTHHI